MSFERKVDEPKRYLLPGTKKTNEAIGREMELLRKGSKTHALTEDEKQYGHALGNFGQYAQSGGESIEDKRNVLKDKALKLIEKYGEKFIDVMAPELLEALGLQDVKHIK